MKRKKLLDGIFTSPQESVTLNKCKTEKENKCKTEKENKCKTEKENIKDNSLFNKLDEKQDKVREISELQKQTKRKLEIEV